MSKPTLIALLIVTNLLAFFLGTQFSSNSESESTSPELSSLNEGANEKSNSVQQPVDAKVTSDVEVSSNTTQDASMNDTNIELTKADVQDETRSQEALLEKIDELNEKYLSSQAELTSQRNSLDQAHTLLREANIDIPNLVTLEEAKEHIPQPFAGLVADSPAFISDDFRKLYEAEEEFEWGPQMEQNISDFILTHEHAFAVELESVFCRANICEVRGFPVDPELWRDHVLSDMATQAWWTFVSTSSMSGISKKDDGNETYFYLLASK